MKDLIDPRTGELRDFAPMKGDESYAKLAALKSKGRQRWGDRVLLSVNPAFAARKARTTATVIDTGDLGRNVPISVQMRFAAADANGDPILPFTPIFPFVNGAILDVRVRRGGDPQSTVATEGYTFAGTSPTIMQDVLPFDIVLARSLGVDLTLTNIPATNPTFWVEAIASPVHEIAQRDRMLGWPVTVPVTNFVAAVATPGNVILLQGPHFRRRQFIIVNTSANADLILNFGTGASWTGPVGSVVLGASAAGALFPRYESPVGGYIGLVSGSWNNAAPNGGALVTEGSTY